ncbi:MAG TPA: right-handed parallel beta-helix repeat-containing protein [Streptosporangiaceae bacterium]|jgi:parallel beta-helix repeat protein
MRRFPLALGATAAAGVLSLATAATPALAASTSTSTSTVYVSPAGTSTGADTSCQTAGYSDINAAIAAVDTGGTVVVCPGTYKTQAVVTKPLTLTGDRGAYINAKGQPPLKIGSTKLPGSIGIGVLATKGVHVSGFHITGAGFDAILVALSSHVTVSGNTLMHNGDVGVDLNGSSWSTATHNVSEHNHGGGFLVADDVGPNSHNTVSFNIASRNPGGCGVILAGHTTAGVSHNRVYGNLLSYNGTLASTGGGAGVVIATEVPGETVADNTVSGNVIWGNGIAGVTIHAHEPGQNLNGNRISNNWIGTNNTLGDFIGLAPKPGSKKNVATPDTRTTGILVGSSSPIAVHISGNHIASDHYGIFVELLKSAVAGSQVTILDNAYSQVATHVRHVVVPAS